MVYCVDTNEPEELLDELSDPTLTTGGSVVVVAGCEYLNVGFVGRMRR